MTLSSDTGTDGIHAILGQLRNCGFITNRQEISVSMENFRPEGTEEQYITSTSGKYLFRSVHVRRSESIRKYPRKFEPVFGAARQ